MNLMYTQPDKNSKSETYLLHPEPRYGILNLDLKASSALILNEHMMLLLTDTYLKKSEKICVKLIFMFPSGIGNEIVL